MKQKTFTLLLVFILCGSFMLFAQNNKISNTSKNKGKNTKIMQKPI